MNNREVAIELKAVNKRLGTSVILEDANFIVRYGELVSIVGPNGSGKTLLLRMLSGLVYADSGSVRVGDTQLRRNLLGPLPDVGVIIETPGFLPHLTGRDNLRLLAGLRGRIGVKEVDAAIQEVGLNPDDRKVVGHYSLGMRQRLAVAQAFMERPKILLLDEVTNALDPEFVDELLAKLRTKADEGAAVVVTTHEVTRIGSVEDRRLTVRNQRIVPFTDGIR